MTYPQTLRQLPTSPPVAGGNLPKELHTLLTSGAGVQLEVRTPHSAPVYQIAEFLSDLGKMCDRVQYLAYATIMGYCTSISEVHNGFRDSPSASNHQVLHTLMK